MSALLTPQQFTSKVVGAPWAPRRADWGAMNCYGLVMLYFRHVLGIELEEMPHSDIVAGFAASRGWRECEPCAGVTCFMAWHDSAPAHCGVLLSESELLHADGSEDRPGSVRVSRLRAMQQIYGVIRFYLYEPC
ncbi:NlpC/P60 family protein [Acidovorax sp. Be4]|uniref:NlpC/P60 family protein n=1 Tax=Acidovorax bellezanensis TaxID=2976702 RepID=A0ABT2PPL2_9BURK|nr:NlpC/P60 family protein [Acidovorax sp. Be4]MCT9812410.1 NlpC/P60 family protein [Acidovorax sp. Be4]